MGRFADRDTISLTATGMSMGTYGYAAPEISEEGSDSFKEGSPALDIFALGGVIYYVFSKGARPDMINPRNVQADILSVVRRCREQNPTDRPQSVDIIYSMISAICRSRGSYDTIKDIVADDELNDEQVATQSISLFSKAQTMREALDVYGEMRNLCWTKIAKSNVNYSDSMIQVLLRIEKDDNDTWLQYEDIDVISDFTVVTVSHSKDDILMREMFRVGLKLAVNYNRYAAMRRIFSGIICKWDTTTVLPFCEVIITERELLESVESAIEVTMPGVVKKYWL